MNANLNPHLLGSETVLLKESHHLPFEVFSQNPSLFGLSGTPYYEVTQRQKSQTIHYQLLSSTAIDEMLNLQDYIYDMLPSKTHLVKDTREDLYKAFSSGFAIGILDDQGSIVGYRLVAIPEKGETHLLENDLKLDRILPKSAHLETTIVLPNYRGNQLQFKTLVMAQKILHEQNVTDILCTVSPYNVYSLSNVMKAGLRIKALKRKYSDKLTNSRGIWRFILHKSLQTSLEIDFPVKTSIQRVQFNQQQKLLDNGYEGISLVDHSNHILYVHS